MLGEEVAAFEEEFARFCGAHYGIGLNSGTSALHLALLAAGIGPGDEVITVPFTFVATVAAIRYTGARPVFVDIDLRSFTMDVTQVEQAICHKTKAIVPVHLYGQPADMDPILEIARRHNLVVIEDAAQAHGAQYKGRRVGGIGDLGCFSFYPSKNLGAYGEGGMVVTNNPQYAQAIRMLRSWEVDQRSSPLVGYNYRMDGVQGAVLRVKLRRLEAWNEARRACATHYDRLLSTSSVLTPSVMPHSDHVYHIYAIRALERDLLQQSLQARGVQTRIHYPVPLHLHRSCYEFGYKPGDFPQSEKAACSVLSLPMHPDISESQLALVVQAIKQGIQ